MTTHDPVLRAALDWAARNDAASDDLRRDTQQALQLLDATDRLLASVVDDNADNLAALRAAERDARTALCDAPTRDNLATVVTLQRSHDDTQVLHERRVHAAEHACSHARHAAQRALAAHPDALLHLVALERCSDVDACGDDAVPEHVRYAWARIAVQYHPDLDELLRLSPQFRGFDRCPQRQHLLLTWRATESKPLRDKFAWCWQQIAAGNTQRVNVPLTLADRRAGTQPGSLGTCLQLGATNATP
jgi:hypothetical protein